MGKSTISMAIFNRYVSLAEGTGDARYCTMNVDELQTTMAEEPPQSDATWM
jgi:hypothetical protein